MDGSRKPPVGDSHAARAVEATICVAGLERVTPFYTQVFGLQVPARQSGWACWPTGTEAEAGR
jgi:catechol-2,3-dioxygenase